MGHVYSAKIGNYLDAGKEIFRPIGLSYFIIPRVNLDAIMQ